MNIKGYQIRFIQVGDSSKGGDAIVMRLLDGNNNSHVVVIDGGYKQNGYEILDVIRNEWGMDTIEIVFNTHPDRDHIGGLITLFEDEDIKINKLVMNLPWKDANLKKDYFKDGRITYNSLKARLQDKFKQAEELEQKAIAKIGEDKIVHAVVNNSYLDCITILGPSTPFYRKYLLACKKTPAALEYYFDDVDFSEGRTTSYSLEPSDKNTPIEWLDDDPTSEINQTSIILLLNVAGKKILFTGDAGIEAITEAIDNAGIKPGEISVMQLPHHGSRKNMHPDLISKISAKLYFISCPPDGMDEGHHSRRLVNKIYQMLPDAQIYSTQDGSKIYTVGYQTTGNGSTPLPFYNLIDGAKK